MEKIEYRLCENQLKAEDFIRLKVATGFRDRPIDQVERALQNDLFDIVAIHNEEVIGMGRLVGDGVMYWYLQEIIVMPEYQGKELVQTLFFEVDVNGWTKLVAEKNLVKKELQLGFAEVDITPSKPMKLVGFYRGDSRSRGVLAPLMAQVAVWKSEGTCCLITIDSIGFTRELSNALRERVGKHLEVLPEKVMLCFSHTHAAPDADEERDYYEEVSNKIEECVSKAKENLSTVSVGWDNGEAKIGVNRRWISEDTDDRIGILKICDEQTKRPKLLILRVTAHGNVLKRDNYMVSPDYFGDVRMVAGQRFRCPVMVIQGAAGSTAPKYFCSQETPVDAQSEQCMRSKDALVEMANLIVESVSEKFDAIIPNKELAVHMYTEHIELISDVPSREKALHIAEDAKILCGIEDTGWLEKVASLNMTGVQECCPAN